MPLNSAELELHPEQNPTDSLNALSQKLYTRNIQNERLKLAQEGKREQGGNFLKDYLNPQHYLTGSAYDPVITSKLQSAMQRGASMAQQGADIPTLLMALGPMVDEVNQYTTKAKVIDQNIKDNLAKLKDYKGYNQDAIYDEAKKAAFHDLDPKTGEYGELKDINKVDPSENYVINAIRDHPDKVASAKGFEEYAKSTPVQTSLQNITTYDSKLRMNKYSAHLTGQNYMIPDTDEKGVTKELVPRYDHANDGGQELLHEGKPVRLLDEGVFDDIMKSHPDAGDYMRGIVGQHLKEYNANSDEPITLGSPQAKLVARALAYDELKRHSTSSIQNANVIGKPSAAEVNIHYYGGDEERAYNRAKGRLQAKADVEPKAKPANAAQTFARIFNNDPDYTAGSPEEIDGKQVIDVGKNFPTAELRGGHGEGDAFAHVYYNPIDRTVTTEDKAGHRSSFGEADLPNFLQNNATANKLNKDKVLGDLEAGGWKDNRFETPADAAPLVQGAQRGLADRSNNKINKGVDALFTTEKGDKLKGAKTALGTVTGASKGFWGNKYYVTVKGQDGKEKELPFASKEEMLKALQIQGGTTDQPVSAPATTPAAANKKGIFD